MNWRNGKSHRSVQLSHIRRRNNMLHSLRIHQTQGGYVRVTDTIIEIFYNHNRIASHRHLYGRKRQYSTVTGHMPADYQKYLEWNDDRFCKWAGRIGTNTCKVVNVILVSQRFEQ